MILALDLFFRVDPQKARQHHPEVIELSRILRALHPEAGSDATLWSNDSVHLKLQKFLRLDSSYLGSAMSAGNRLEAEVWDDFAHDNDRLHRVATSIKAAIQIGVTAAKADSEEIEAPEGRILTREHRARERASGLVAKKKARAIREYGALRCEVCDFEERGSSNVIIARL